MQNRFNVDTPNASGETATLIAARSGELETLRILLQAGANANTATSDGVTALMLAATHNDAELARRLLLADATIWARDRSGNSPILFAARSGSPETVRLLLTAGADPNAGNSSGLQPIEAAGENPRGDEIIQILLTAGATPPPEPAEDQEATDDDTVEPGPEDDNEDDEQAETEPEDDDDDQLANRPENAGQRAGDDRAERNPNAGQRGGDDDRAASDPDGAQDNDEDRAPAGRPDPVDTRNVLYPGAQSPANADGATINLSGYTNSVPAAWNRRLHSKENPQTVTLIFDNWYTQRVEVFKIQENGEPVGVGRPEPYSSLPISTRQGNVFAIYGVDGAYFGHFTTTGQGEQRLRVDTEQ